MSDVGAAARQRDSVDDVFHTFGAACRVLFDVCACLRIFGVNTLALTAQYFGCRKHRPYDRLTNNLLERMTS